MRIINNKKKEYCRRGFSLPELLISICLMAFVGSAAVAGIVVINRIRNQIEREAIANQIMIATVNYLRADLDDCDDPQTMDCTISNGSGSVYYPCLERYSLVRVYSNSKKAEATFQRILPKVKYYNTANGIMVCIECSSYNLVEDPKGKFDNTYKYLPGKEQNKPNYQYTFLLAEDVMNISIAGTDGKVQSVQYTGMCPKIGGVKYEPGDDGYDPDFDKYAEPGKITYSNETKLFYFTVDIVDKNTGEVILSQRVTVCPDTLIPSTSNP